MQMAQHEKPLKTGKFDLRMSEEERSLIDQAARIRHTTSTNFIREEALAAAESVVHEQNRFVLNEEQWQALTDALSRPPRVLKKLKRQMAEADSWDA